MNAEVKPGYKQTEAGFIPDAWSTSTVGEYFDIQLGKMLDAEKNIGVPKPYLGNKSVQWGRIDIAELSEMAMSSTDITRYRLRQGDLLVCEGGEVGRAAIWESPIEECYYQKALHRLRPKRYFNVRLMQALLQHWANNNLLTNFVTQTSIAHLPKEKFQTIPLPVPPNAEQEAIASALSEIDVLISSLDQLIAKKRDIQQAAMQQLLTGQRRLPGFSGEWEVKRLGDFGQCLRGVSYKGDADLLAYDTDETYRLLRSNNVQQSAIDVDGLQFVNARCVSSHQVLKPKDILICMANGSKDLVGKAGLFKVYDGHRYTFGAFMGCFRMRASAEPDFIFALFGTNKYKNYIANLLAGSSINNLRPRDIEQMEFRFPPKDEQAGIASLLSDMDSELTALEARRKKACQLKQGMMQELLTGRIRLV